MQSAMTGSYFLFWYLTCEWLNVESPQSAYNFILEIMEFFPSLALAWSLSDQTAESEVTVGCARPVNPLKLSPTLSTLNFRTWGHENTSYRRKYFCFYISLFNDDKFYNIPFVGFLRRSTKGKEVFDWNIYPQQAFISGPQYREAWSVPWLIYLLLNTLSATRWKVDRLKWEFDCFDWPLWWL
jgi:hypothetical protein